LPLLPKDFWQFADLSIGAARACRNLARDGNQLPQRATAKQGLALKVNPDSVERMFCH
tara:strand:+ start:697 stop:870 length:174 start_codon:yes stop_codon:yes gene_type:complete